MPVRLKNLNESLERKYGLNESTETETTELTEKLSDSMPDWLKKRLLVTKYSNGGNRIYRNLGTHKSNADNKNPEDDFSKRPTYARGRGDVNTQDQSLFGRMLTKGINLDDVTVEEGAVPTKRTDPRLKEPNIPIFLMKNGQVYAKGLNDQEEYRDDGSKPFKYVPMKTLLADCENFAYIDGNNDNNFSVENKRISRNLMNKSLKDLPNYDRVPNVDGSGEQYVPNKGWVNLDKSGYIVIPTIEKYKQKLSELKCNKIHDILKEKEDYLNYVKEELSNILMNADIKSDLSNMDSDFSQAFSALFDWFKDSVRALNSIEYRLQNIFDTSNNYSKDEQRKAVLDIINNDWDYRRLMENIRKIEKVAPKLFNSIIDWI